MQGAARLARSGCARLPKVEVRRGALTELPPARHAVRPRRSDSRSLASPRRTPTLAGSKLTVPCMVPPALEMSEFPVPSFPSVL